MLSDGPVIVRVEYGASSVLFLFDMQTGRSAQFSELNVRLTFVDQLDVLFGTVYLLWSVFQLV